MTAQDYCRIENRINETIRESAVRAVAFVADQWPNFGKQEQKRLRYAIERSIEISLDDHFRRENERLADTDSPG